VVNTAIQEDVDVVGLSILSGAHLHLTQRVLKLLKDKGGEDVQVIVGGVIPEKDKAKLRAMGVAEVFTSGADIKEISRVINEKVKTE
jgi:methylmalonyl-CoA mutase C-terminal domain/subunit